MAHMYRVSFIAIIFKCGIFLIELTFNQYSILKIFSMKLNKVCLFQSLPNYENVRRFPMTLCFFQRRRLLISTNLRNKLVLWSDCLATCRGNTVIFEFSTNKKRKDTPLTVFCQLNGVVSFALNFFITTRFIDLDIVHIALQPHSLASKDIYLYASSSSSAPLPLPLSLVS